MNETCKCGHSIWEHHGNIVMNPEVASERKLLVIHGTVYCECEYPTKYDPECNCRMFEPA